MLLYIFIMELEINEKKPSNIKLIKTDDDGFVYTDDDLTIDKLYTTDALLRKEKFLDAKMKVKEIDEMTSLRRKVIRIALTDLGYDFMTNIHNLQPNQKKKLQLKMNEYEIVCAEDIENKFNEICNDHMFDNPQFDYSKIPVYNA